MSSRTLLTTFLATALTLPLLAQTATPPAESSPSAPAKAAVAEPVPAAVVPAAVPAAPAAPAAAPVAVTRDKDTLSVDFPDEDIKTILRNVADLFELNLVVPDTVTGKTSIKLRDVTWRQIFQTVLAPINFTYVEDGNIIKIVSNELLQQEPGSTEVFILNNAKAADIKPTIDGLIDAATGGKIVIDARSNSLVITERPSRMARIRSIIDQLDKATDQVMIESKFVEVSDGDIRNIGVNWASLSGTTLGIGQIQQTFSRTRSQDFTNGGNTNASNNTGSTGGTTNTNTTTNTGGTTAATTQSNTGSQIGTNILTGLPQVVNVASSGTTTIDTAPMTQTNSTMGSTGGTTSSATTAIQNLVSLTNAGGTSRVASAVFSSSDFNVIVSALKSQNNTKVMSNPTIVTLNNTEATLNIGQEFPVPNYTYNSERGVFEVSGFTYKPIGIILKVTPQVNARGIIKLALEPEVSQQANSTNFGGATIPIVTSRKVKTQVSLKDGYTMGIGGLITDSKNHGGTKVPVLGDIPLLGRLFSSKSVNDVATNLIIFITAKTVNADGASPEEVFDPRAIQAIGLSRDELPGHRVSKGGDLYAPAPAPEQKQ